MHANSLGLYALTHANFCFIAVNAFSLYFACVRNNARAGINNNKVLLCVYVRKRGDGYALAEPSII